MSGVPPFDSAAAWRATAWKGAWPLSPYPPRSLPWHAAGRGNSHCTYTKGQPCAACAERPGSGRGEAGRGGAFQTRGGTALPLLLWLLRRLRARAALAAPPALARLAARAAAACARCYRLAARDPKCTERPLPALRWRWYRCRHARFLRVLRPVAIDTRRRRRGRRSLALRARGKEARPARQTQAARIRGSTVALSHDGTPWPCCCCYRRRIQPACSRGSRRTWIATCPWCRSSS